VKYNKKPLFMLLKCMVFHRVKILYLMCLLSFIYISGCGGGGGTDPGIYIPTSTPSPAKGNIRGMVLDVNNNPLNGIFVAFYSYDYPAGRDTGKISPDKTTSTNSKGEFTFENVPQGDFRLEAWRSGSDYTGNLSVPISSVNSTLTASEKNLNLIEGVLEFTYPFWQWKESGTSENLLDVYFTDELNGWATGNYATMLHSGDGGNTWQEVVLATFEDIRAIHFTDKNNGYAVGSEGTVFHTGNGGEKWEEVYICLTPLNDIFFADSLHGWAAGNEGTIIITEDGGNTWDETFIWTLENIRSIYFTDENNGWAAGEEGNVLYTSDGGNTWDIQLIWDMPINDVFIRGSKGWAVENEGFIFYTSDRGNNWEDQFFSYYILKDLYFTDERHGWAVGESGAILHTGDGGENWLYEDSDTIDDLRAVYFIDENTGWAVGELGIVIVYRRYITMKDIN